MQGPTGTAQRTAGTILRHPHTQGAPARVGHSDTGHGLQNSGDEIKSGKNVVTDSP